MFDWLRRVFAPANSPALPPPAPDPKEFADAVAPMLTAALDGAVTTLKGSQDELLEQVKKLARANQKLALQVESLASKPAVPAPAVPAPAPAAPEPSYEAVLDAMDALDHAVMAASDDDALDSFVAGLEGVQERLSRFLEGVGVTRVGARGEAPEPRLHKVVGTTDDEDVEEGAVARVVRAGARKGDRVLRVGEVITRRFS